MVCNVVTYRARSALRTAPLLLVEGRLLREGQTVSVVVQRLVRRDNHAAPDLAQ